MANQYEVDPRQAEFLKNYLDPKSKTFSNALQSALSAKYSQEYAENILSLMPDWLSESIADVNLVGKAVRNLSKFLDDDTDKRIQADITKFTLERLNKKKFSARSELTGADGKDLTIQVVNYADLTPQLPTENVSTTTPPSDR